MYRAPNASENIAPQSLQELQKLQDLLVQRDAEINALRQQLAQPQPWDAWMHAVSHDLRAPLRHVLAFTPLIAELLEPPSGTPQPAELQEALSFVRTMEQSAQRMAAMFDGLLQLSRAARHPLQCRSVDLAALLQRLQEQLSAAQAPGRCITWEVDIPPGLQLHADAALLEQALREALSNALKFSRQQPHSRIAVQAQPSAGQWQIHIRDNGAGFDDTRAQRLFGIFQRMHRESEFEGVGTGLALIQAICQRHAGQAHISARPGQGCELVMHWPSADHAAQQASTPFSVA